MYPGFAPIPQLAVLCADEGKTGVDLMRTAGKPVQHLGGLFGIAGFAHYFPIQIDDCIGADDNRRNVVLGESFLR